MNYTTLARQFVKGLIKRTEGTPFEPLRLHILSQWIYESNHFRSKLATQFHNAGGMQFREGYTGPHSKALYKDWQGKEKLHFLLTNPEYYCDLYLWFIGREHYRAVDNIPNTGHPGDFIIELAYDNYVTDMKNPITNVDELQTALVSVGLPKFSDLMGHMYTKDELTYAESIPWNYLHRIQSIANRPETLELLRHEWTDKTANLMGLEPQQITIPEDREWLNTEVEVDILTGNKI